MKKILLTFLVLLTFISAKSSIIQRTYKTPINRDYNVTIYIPDNMGDNKYPLLLFITGNGEVGSDWSKAYTHGPLRFIRDNNWRPNMIIATIQSDGQWPNYFYPNNTRLKIIEEFGKNINLNRYYLTGLSGGAACIYSVIRNTSSSSYVKPHAVVPMSITIDALCGDYYQQTDYLCGNDLRFALIASWGFCGQSDSHFHKQKRYHQLLINAGYQALWTTYAGGHTGWNTFYNPNWKGTNGLSIYDWMMLYSDDIVPVTISKIEYKSNNNKFDLTIETATETNNSHFEILKSYDNKNFFKIAEIKSQAESGNSTTTLTYKFKDLIWEE